jgi:hypothetical protein
VLHDQAPSRSVPCSTPHPARREAGGAGSSTACSAASGAAQQPDDPQPSGRLAGSTQGGNAAPLHSNNGSSSAADLGIKQPPSLLNRLKRMVLGDKVGGKGGEQTRH